MWRVCLPVFLGLWPALQVCTITLMADPTEDRLARELHEDELYEASAVEFRRLAIGTSIPIEGSAYYWAAAHAYWRNGQLDLVDRMLDHAEDLSDAHRNQSLLLRAEVAMEQEDWNEALYFLESVASREAVGDPAESVRRRLASVQAQMGDMDAAASSLRALSSPPPEAISALEEYGKGRDKSPRLGGALGIIPGLGYVYAGEYGNALRSMILNALFIYGMIDTAQEEQWGGFGVITFFELTWYSGSIYGGFDAAHRYNRDRLLAVAEVIEGESELRPDYGKIPVIQLTY